MLGSPNVDFIQPETNGWNLNIISLEKVTHRPEPTSFGVPNVIFMRDGVPLNFGEVFLKIPKSLYAIHLRQIMIIVRHESSGAFRTTYQKNSPILPAIWRFGNGHPTFGTKGNGHIQPNWQCIYIYVYIHIQSYTHIHTYSLEVQPAFCIDWFTNHHVLIVRGYHHQEGTNIFKMVATTSRVLLCRGSFESYLNFHHFFSLSRKQEILRKAQIAAGVHHWLTSEKCNTCSSLDP